VHTNDAVVHLAATAEPLPADADGLVAAFGRSRFIDAADRLGVGVFVPHQLLALIAKFTFIPLDRFQETL
jgi:hypothetical protein